MTPRDRTPGRDGRVVSQVIDALIAGRGIRPEDVYLAVGLTRSTYYNRLGRGDWKVDEVAEIARILNEPISSFFDGLGGRFTGDTPALRSRSFHEYTGSPRPGRSPVGAASPLRDSIFRFENNIVADVPAEVA